MDENRLNKKVISAQEEKALDEFFKALNLSFKNSSMYFRKHPHFIKGIQDLEQRLREVTAFRKTLAMEITPDNILLDGQSIGKGRFPYRDIAQFLHKRKVRRLKINTLISTQDLGDFVFRIAQEVKEGSFLVGFLKNIKDIEIEELDYSYLLASRGKHSQDVWRALLAKGSLQAVDTEISDYILNNVASIINEVSSEDGILADVFNNFENLSASLGWSPQERVQNFTKNLFSSLFNISTNFLDKFLKEENYPKLKKVLSKNLEKDFLLRNIIDDLLDSKQFKPIFLNLYNIITEEEKNEEDLAEEVSKFLSKSDFIKDKVKTAESLRELFSAYSKSKFISKLYKNTLAFLSDYLIDSSENREVFEDYIKELSEENIRRNYFCTLLELLRLEDIPTDIELLISKIEPEFPLLLEQQDINAIKELISLLEEKKSSSKYPEVLNTLENFHKKICDSQLLNFILQNLQFLEDLEGLSFILKRIKDAAVYIIDEFFKEGNELTHRKISKLLQNLADENSVAIFRSRLKRKPSIFILGEIIEILSKIITEDSATLLEELYRNNQDNKILSRDILRAMRANPFKNKKFLDSLILNKDYFLRKEAVGSFLDIAKDEDKTALMNKLIRKPNFLGLRDKFIVENIDILTECGFKEIAPYLAKFVIKKPWLFRKKRDSLRIKSLESLIRIDPDKVKKLIPELLKDNNEKIKTLTQEVKEK